MSRAQQIASAALALAKSLAAAPASAAKFIATRSALVAGAGSSTGFEMVSPGPQVGTDGIDDTSTFRINFTSGKFTQGPTGHTNYWDNTYSIGWNSTTNATKLVSTIPAFSMFMETKFAQGGATDPFCAELYWAFIPADSTSQLRSFSGLFPHLIGDWPTKSQTYFRSAQYSLNDGSGIPRILIDVSPGINRFYLQASGAESPPVLTCDKNNIQFIAQLNAAASGYLPLWWLNTRNELSCSQPILRQVVPVAGLFSYVGIENTQITSPSSVMTLKYTLSSAGPTTVTWQRVEIDASTLVTALQLKNTNATGNILARLETVGGDSLITLKAGSSAVSLGIDVSDSNSVVLEMTDGAVGTAGNQLVRFDRSSKVAAFGGAIKSAVATIAGLPSASTAGNGAQMYASNGRKSGEGAAAGTGIPVWSDATNWRTYYDNSIAAA